MRLSAEANRADRSYAAVTDLLPIADTPSEPGPGRDGGEGEKASGAGVVAEVAGRSSTSVLPSIGPHGSSAAASAIAVWDPFGPLHYGWTGRLRYEPLGSQ